MPGGIVGSGLAPTATRIPDSGIDRPGQIRPHGAGHRSWGDGAVESLNPGFTF